MRPALAAFERASGHTTRLVFAAAPVLRATVAGTPSADVVVVTQGIVDELAAKGTAIGARAPIGRVGVGVAVRPGVDTPDVADSESLKAALVGADSVVFNRASTGLYVERMLQRLGMADVVNAKATREHDGASVMKRLLAGTARREFGFGATTEILLFRDQGVKLSARCRRRCRTTPPMSRWRGPERRPSTRHALRRSPRSSAICRARRCALCSPTPVSSRRLERGRDVNRPTSTTTAPDADATDSATCAIRRCTASASSSSPTTTSGASPPSGGIARRLTAGLSEPSTPSLSPDGRWLAYVGRDEHHPEVHVMPADGGQSRRLTWLGVDAQVRGWTPAGEIVYVTTARPAVLPQPPGVRGRAGRRAARAARARPGQPHRLRRRRPRRHRPQHRRPGALEALPRRPCRRDLGRRRRQRLVPPPRLARRQRDDTDVDRRAPLLPRRRRRRRQPLLVPGRRQRPAPPHRPRHSSTRARRKATASASSTPAARACGCSIPPPTTTRELAIETPAHRAQAARRFVPSQRAPRVVPAASRRPLARRRRPRPAVRDAALGRRADASRRRRAGRCRDAPRAIRRAPAPRPVARRRPDHDRGERRLGRGATGRLRRRRRGANAAVGLRPRQRAGRGAGRQRRRLRQPSQRGLDRRRRERHAQRRRHQRLRPQRRSRLVARRRLARLHLPCRHAPRRDQAVRARERQRDLAHRARVPRLGAGVRSRGALSLLPLGAHLRSGLRQRPLRPQLPARRTALSDRAAAGRAAAVRPRAARSRRERRGCREEGRQRRRKTRPRRCASISTASLGASPPSRWPRTATAGSPASPAPRSSGRRRTSSARMAAAATRKRPASSSASTSRPAAATRWSRRSTTSRSPPMP